MPVIDNSILPTFRLPGITHQTVARQGQAGMRWLLLFMPRTGSKRRAGSELSGKFLEMRVEGFSDRRRGPETDSSRSRSVVQELVN